MKLYKLTNKSDQTKNSTQWGENATHSLSPTPDPKLCSEQVLHAYRSLNLGLLLNPIHASLVNPRVWEAEGDVVVEDYGKVGCFSLTTTKEVSLPGWYTDLVTRSRVQVQFAILCAEQVLPIFEAKYPNDARPRVAIEAARGYLKNPTPRATRAAARATDDAADAARAAAAAAAYAAYAAAYADAARAARAAARAADAAADAARADAYAAARAADAYAYAAARAAKEIDFSKLADQAVANMLVE